MRFSFSVPRSVKHRASSFPGKIPHDRHWRAAKIRNKKQSISALFLFAKKTVHPALCCLYSRDAGSQLRADGSAAHKTIHLLLLPSGPDRVHGVLLHRIHPSTLLTGSIHCPGQPAAGDSASL